MRRSRTAYEDKDVLAWLTAQQLVNRAVPELFHHLPVVDHAAAHQVLDVVSLRVLEGIVTNVEVKLVALHL